MLTNVSKQDRVLGMKHYGQQHRTREKRTWWVLGAQSKTASPLDSQHITSCIFRKSMITLLFNYLFILSWLQPRASGAARDTISKTGRKRETTSNKKVFTYKLYSWKLAYCSCSPRISIKQATKWNIRPFNSGWSCVTKRRTFTGASEASWIS